MKTEDIDTRKASDWVPCTDLQTLATLGKLAEEAGELISIISRCIIQGMDGVDPETKKPNLTALGEEIADVMGMCKLAVYKLDVDPSDINERAEKKRRWKLAWIQSLERP